MAKSSSPAMALEKVIVRLPDGMRDLLKTSAEANNRSMNAEIVARLEASFQNKVETIGPSVEYMEDYLKRLDERYQKLYGPMPHDPLPPFDSRKKDSD